MAQELTLIVRAEDRASQVLKTLQVNVKQTVTVTKTATAANKAVGRSALTASKGINSMAASTRRMITAVAGASVMYAMVRGVRAATKEYVEYNKQLHNVWTLTDYTGDKLDALGTRIRHLAMDFNVTASESLKAMYQIYSATFYGESAFLILEESLKGAAAGLSDVFTVADMMTTVLNAYNMEATEATHVNDVLFTTIKYGKTTMHELAMQFGRLAGIAAPMNIGIEDMSAAIATLTKRGIATDWAITALRQSIMQIMRPSAELEKVIKKLGYASGTTMLKEHGFSESLKMIKAEADTTGTGLEKLFSNVRAIIAVLPLATTAAKDYAENRERMADVEGASAEAFKKQTEAISFQLGVLGTGLKDLGAIAAEVFMHDMAIYIRDTLVPIVKTLAFYIDQNREALNYFITGAAKVIGVVMLIYGLSKGFWLLTKPIIWLIAAASLLYAVWATNLYGIRDIVDNIGDSLDAVITWGLNMVGLGAMAESVTGWSGALKAGMIAAAGIGLSRFLISALFKTGKGGFSMKGGLATVEIGLLAAMAWDVTNDIGNIKEPGVAGDLAPKLLGGVLGAALGIAAAAMGVLNAWWIIPIAGAGYALGIGVKALMDITWDVANNIGEVSGDEPSKDPSNWNPANWIGNAYNAALGAMGRGEASINTTLGFGKGGGVPGFGAGDTIPAMLEPGEFVIPKWMMETGFGDEIYRVWSSGKKMAAGGSASFSASGGTGFSSFNPEGVSNHLERLISGLDTTTKNILGPIAKFFSTSGQDSGAVLTLFTNLISLLSASEEAKVYFEDLIRGMQETIDEMNNVNESMTEAFSSFTSTINDLLKGELVTAIRDLLGNIFGMNDEAGEAANSFNIPKLMKLTRAAWGAAIPGQSYDQSAGEEETSAWDRIANGMLEAVALLLGSIIWSEVIAKVIWTDYISPLLSWMWSTFIEGPAQAVWDNVLKGPTQELWKTIFGERNAPDWATILGVAAITIMAASVILNAEDIMGGGIETREGYEEGTVTVDQVAGLVGTTGTGALAGAAAGAAIGSIIPVVGTAIGAAVGTVVGGIYSLWDYLTPGMAVGGEVLKAGMARLHKDELVVPASVATPFKASGAGLGASYNTTITGNQFYLPNVTNAEEFAEEMERVTQMKNLQETGNRYGPYEA